MGNLCDHQWDIGMIPGRFRTLVHGESMSMPIYVPTNAISQEDHWMPRLYVEESIHSTNETSQNDLVYSAHGESIGHPGIFDTVMWKKFS